MPAREIREPTSSPEAFKYLWQDVENASQRALLLDYDGTLAPFKVERDEAVPYPGVRELLEQIIYSDCSRLVIVTGRWTRDIMPLLNLKITPEIWGSHGIERLYPDGTLDVLSLPHQILEGLDRAREWARQGGYAERCEEKPGCFALHWRGLDNDAVEAIRGAAEPLWRELAMEHGLGVHEFDGGIELRAFGRNKGDAVSTILGEMGDAAVCVYLGDDLTDEDAFAALKGRGWGVLVREMRRPTMADLWLRPPEELLDFLAKWGSLPVSPAGEAK